MKIETNKNFAATKTNFAKPSAAGKSAESAPDANSTDTDFASILENLGGKEKRFDSKNSDPLEEARRHEDKTERQTVDKKLLDNNERRDDNTKNGEQSREDAAAAASHAHQARDATTIEPEGSLPPARAMLHIADLERIVSSLRTHSFDGQNQIEITLKNSVFDGLKIKLTADENRRITAEFVAANEKVKTQIDARSSELADILRQRGVKLSSLQTSVGADASGGQHNNNYESLAALDAPGKAKSGAAEIRGDELIENVESNDKIGHTYRV